MSRERELVSKTAIITIGRISTQCVSFFLLPLYTAVLSTEEYGIVDLAITIVQLLVPVVTLMIDQGVFRLLLNSSHNEDKIKIISAGIQLLIFTCIAFNVIYFVIPYENPYKVMVSLLLVTTCFSNLGLQIVRGLGYTADYALGSFFCSAVTIAFNVIFIVGLRMGANGMILASIIGNVSCFFLVIIRKKIWSYISLGAVDKKIMMEELSYSIPLVPNQLSVWIMNSSDRFIVSILLGVTANGILAVSHKFPAIFGTFFNIFLLAWHEIGAVHYFDKDRDCFFSEMMDKIFVLFFSLGIMIVACLPFTFKFLVNQEFYESYYSIPIYIAASVFNVVVGSLGVVYIATKKTKEIAKTTIISAVINILVHLILIKLLGLYAAAISTFVGYGISMMYRIVDARKYLVLSWNKKRIVALSVIFLISSLIYYIENKIIAALWFVFLVPILIHINKDIAKGVLSMIKVRKNDKT